MLRTNTLIIGGGPAGSTAARLLAAHGVETILAERDLSYVKPCGGGIPSTALDELQIPEGVVKSRIGKIKIVSPAGQEVEIGLTGGHLCITNRGELDVKLRAMAEASGAAITEGEFIGFEEIGNSIVSVIRKKADGEQLRIKSDYVIASDGITSKVGSALNSPRPDYLYTISAHMRPADYDCCEFWFGTEHAKNFYSWIFPAADRCSIGTGGTTPRELSGLLDKFVRRRFAVPLKNFAENNFSGKARVFKVPKWNGALFNIRNILFAGDAAGTVMPVTYEGIYYAMKSGEFAARAIMEGKPGTYKELWKKRFHTRFLLMSKIKNHLFRNDKNIERWVALHKKPEVQEIAIRLWLHKKSGQSTFNAYRDVFTHVFKGMRLF
ncbi:MAG TPA: geranylgeranyl reductase family protein [Dissulfurispiraceae bacterium]